MSSTRFPPGELQRVSQRNVADARAINSKLMIRFHPRSVLVTRAAGRVDKRMPSRKNSLPPTRPTNKILFFSFAIAIRRGAYEDFNTLYAFGLLPDLGIGIENGSLTGFRGDAMELSLTSREPKNEG